MADNQKTTNPDNNRRKNPYKKPININIGIIIFVFIGIYIGYSLFAYLKSKPIAGYEVKVGSLTSPATFTGLIIRDEEVIYADEAGYVNYYTREGERVSFGDLVYSVDSSGELAELLKSANSDERVMSNEDFNEIRNEIIDFSKDFSTDKFYPVYDFKYSLQGMTLKLSNLNVLSNIGNMSSGRLSNAVRMKNSKGSGYVVFNVDKYEGLEAENVTVENFDRTDYEKKQFVNNELVASGEPVYKLVTSEDWKVIIQTDESTAQRLK
ncbi:MAG: hypothetical protein IKO32_04995 [Lachnospiraceae bacterium]|nr:hypothetical protein [Lachnospiraceae bacterium]